MTEVQGRMGDRFYRKSQLISIFESSLNSTPPPTSKFTLWLLHQADLMFQLAGSRHGVFVVAADSSVERPHPQQNERKSTPTFFPRCRWLLTTSHCSSGGNISESQTWFSHWYRGKLRSGEAENCFPPFQLCDVLPLLVFENRFPLPNLQPYQQRPKAP